ncbi:hypothetical protein GCM10014713_46770 [Streptomyces purpureus]|uniref:Uncharacterized protein n=1 Tax=Streptomyces purpureus TaxID=1951 RepID=A0A918LTJ9_9ACTN|nr:hypothetical protein GCM10014713_46770 [Streptomyces purpureus]
MQYLTASRQYRATHARLGERAAARPQSGFATRRVGGRDGTHRVHGLVEQVGDGPRAARTRYGRPAAHPQKGSPQSQPPNSNAAPKAIPTQPGHVAMHRAAERSQGRMLTRGCA